MKRKGFTLVELLLVIVIIGILAAAMSLAGGSATASAKASTIYNNIRNIKTAALMYQVQAGNQFKESNVNKTALKDFVDLDAYNNMTSRQVGATREVTANNIMYQVVAGTEAGAGAYVICSFNADGDAKAIANALKGYQDIRIDTSDSSTTDATPKYTVGAFLYHNTPAEKGKAADGTAVKITYDVEMVFDKSKL